MIDGCPGIGFVLVNDGKSRAADHVFHPQLFTNDIDESGFAGTHFAIKGEHFSVSGSLNELLRCLFNII